MDFGVLKYLGMPEWGNYLLVGVLLFVGLSAAAVALTRMGRNPYLAFLMLIPYVQIAAVWYLAFTLWPPALKKH